MAAKTVKPCGCSRFTNASTGQTTNCVATTSRTFAPGHDAKLKGFLIRADRAGQMITRMDDNSNVTPGTVASAFGFAAQVAAGSSRVAPSPKKKVAPVVVVPEQIRIKIGRWEYDATRINGEVSYVNGKGESVTATKFTVI